MKCISCSFAKFERDPDPYDWFCDDDTKIICTAGKKQRQVCGGVRPYELKKVEAPKWCILRDK